jgi:hypothetical protein
MRNKKLILSITIIIVLFFLLIIAKKNKHNFRYEVHSYVISNGKTHPAIWKADSIEIKHNYIKYHNSDGTEVVIQQPYVLIDYKYDRVIKDTNY